MCRTEAQGRFAQALVYTSENSGEGFMPRLCADSKTRYSTAAYRKVGFIDCGDVRELTLAW